MPFSLQDELAQRAGSFSTALVPFVPHVVTDARIVTGQNPMSAKGVGKAVAAMLN